MNTGGYGGLYAGRGGLICPFLSLGEGMVLVGDPTLLYISYIMPHFHPSPDDPPSIAFTDVSATLSTSPLPFLIDTFFSGSTITP